MKKVIDGYIARTKPDEILFSDFTFVMVVNLMFQFYCEAFKRKDKED